MQRTDTGSTVAFGRALVGVTRVVAALLSGAEVAATINRDPTLGAAYESIAVVRAAAAFRVARHRTPHRRRRRPPCRPGERVDAQLVTSLRPNRHTAAAKNPVA